jgi:hypothetical protein
VVSYFAQPRVGAQKIDVVVAIMAREIVTRYEAPFRSGGMTPGFVTTSALAMLNAIAPGGMTLVAKLGGRTLSAMVVDGSSLKLVRSIEMESDDREEIESVLHPTFAYIEDELEAKPDRLLLSGFGADTPHLAREWEEQWAATVEPMRSRRGIPSQYNAGLLGYLEAV